MEWHWFLSFRDATRNVSLGGCLVIVDDDDPPNVALAAQKAWDLGCNPGGEVMGFTAEGSSDDIAAAVRSLPEGVLMDRKMVSAHWNRYGIEAGRP